MLAFSIKLDAETVLQALRELLPSLSIKLYDEAIAEAMSQESTVWPDIALEVTPNTDWNVVISDHPIYVDLFLAPEEIEIELARRLSIRFKCSVVCPPGEFKPEHSKDSPYWVIVWKEGQAFLGDDLVTETYEGEGGPIRVHYPIDVPAADLQALVTQWQINSKLKRS